MRERLLAVCGMVWLGGGPGAPVVESADGTIYIASVEGGVEAAVDAPWRLEPTFGSVPVYPSIPIVVSIHDTNQQSPEGPTVALGQFCEVLVIEGDTSPSWRRQLFTPGQLAEVERSDKWPVSSATAANHRLCRQWAGETCSGSDLDIGPSAEWHATLRYTPTEQTPGADVHLTVQVRVAGAGQECGPPREGVWYDAPLDRFGPLPDGRGYVIVNRLSVHLGEEPLPRFDERWVYGDLHYHSQGTDNEGESAYAYRPTLQAMRAMGLDFLFATEHASDSDQITDVNVIYVDNLALDIADWVPFDGAIEDWINGLAASVPLHEEIRKYAARDMNQQRFEAMRALLNDPPGERTIGHNTVPTGANAEVMMAPGGGRPARIFLGGEVDVIPQMDADDRASGFLSYGNGATYRWADCLLSPVIVEKIQYHTSSIFCPSPWDLAELEPATGRYSVHDIQGLGDDSFYARQHMVFLPRDGSRNDAFISGATSDFGGAHEHLFDLLRTDYHKSIVGKGYAFLAHPADGAAGNGPGRVGPDVVPYSDVQLRTAFESPAVLGLQLWNEDTRLHTGGTGSASWSGFPQQPVDFASSPGSRFRWARWLGAVPERQYRELHHGLTMWDRMLQWGIRSSQTAGLLPPGEPRRVFMAGGSDAHGDWNYRREGRFFGVSSIVDTAIGKPRNLVYVGPGRAESVLDAQGVPHGAVGQTQVTDALASGNFSVTDGPALRIAVDMNGNGLIDDADVPMGGISRAPFRGTWIPVIVEWKSTDEFGPVGRIDVYVGAASDAIDAALVYAPLDHGIHAVTTKPGTVAPEPYVDRSGRPHRELLDGYMLDPTGRLQITPGAAERKAGRRVLQLRANDFVVGHRRVVEGEPEECHWNEAGCGKEGHQNDEGCEEVCTGGTPTEYRFDRVTVPDRIFVRAFARTAPKGGAQCGGTGETAWIATATGQCIERLAFTNPIWVDNATVPDFSVACTPSTLAVQVQGTAACTVSSVNGVAAPVTLGCSGLPPNTSCAFDPPSVTPAAGGSAPTTLTVTAGLVAPAGSHTVIVRGTSGVLTRETTMNLTIGAPAGPGALTAAFDRALGAPSCGDAVGVSCDTGALVRGRSLAGGEANAPNTVAGACADGSAGPAFERWPAVDAIRVSSTDGIPFAVGGGIRIEATIWAAGTGAEAVDFFITGDATRPSWTLIGTVAATAGAQKLSLSSRLLSGGRHAVRVQLRESGEAVPCAGGASHDRDDLAFAVAAGPAR